MGQYTIRTGDELTAEIEAYIDETDRKQSADLRELIRNGLDYHALENRLNEKEQQLAAANRKNTKIGELAEYRDEEQSLQRMQNERERLRSEAGVFTRFRWYLTGMPSVESDDG